MIDTLRLASQLRVIESVVVIPRVTSTNTVARRVLEECIENDLPLPSAVIVARQQLAGRGRGERTWESPRDAGIYATILHSRTVDGLATLPLQVAVILARFLRENYAIDAGIKWPNDILVGGRKKIAGILIEARTTASTAYAAIGVGVNVTPVSAELAGTATSISEASGTTAVTDEATTTFIRSIDEELGETAGVVEEWSSLSIHRAGDTVSFHMPAGELTGKWQAIDHYGRAVVETRSGVQQISAADLITIPPS